MITERAKMLLDSTALLLTSASMTVSSSRV